MSYESVWMGKNWDLQLCGSDSELLTDDTLNFVIETIEDKQEKRIKIKDLAVDPWWGIECTYTEGRDGKPDTVEGYHGDTRKKFKITRTMPNPKLEVPNP